MKMRDELELYKSKCLNLEAELKDVVTTCADDLQALVIAHNIEVSELTEKHKKAIESKDSSIKYNNDRANELTEQVNNLHDILDVIPGVMTRKKVVDGYDNGAENKCHVRLASVLAQKFM